MPSAAMLAKIHIAKKDLGLDDHTYRTMLHSIAGVSSAKLLTPQKATMVINHLKRSGFIEKKAKNSTAGRKAPNPTESCRLMMGKVEAMLADRGLPWAYADGIAQQMFKLDAVNFCDAAQLHKIIAALTIQQRRQSRPA